MFILCDRYPQRSSTPDDGDDEYEDEDDVETDDNVDDDENFADVNSSLYADRQADGQETLVSYFNFDSSVL